MSSAILYVAIVAIWACVLVPRWLRRDAAREGLAKIRWSSQTSVPGATEQRAAFAAEGSSDPTGATGDDREQPSGRAGEAVAAAGGDDGCGDGGAAFSGGATGPAAEESAPGAAAGPAVAATAASSPTGAAAPPPIPAGYDVSHHANQERVRRHATAGEHANARDEGTWGDGRRGDAPYGERHSRVPPHHARHSRDRLLKARRRMLMMLAALLVMSVVPVALHMVAWWVVVPPVALLFGYLMLLREAARVDAEHRRRVASERAAVAAERAPLRQRTVHRDQRTAFRRPSVDAPDSDGALRRGTLATPGAASVGRPDPYRYEPVAEAEIIDISARDDEPYDQYTDAKLRAVGD